MRDLSLHILDIVQNSIRANATKITICLRQIADNVYKKNLLELKIADNGAGMDQQFLETADDPFVTTRSSRRVGLGIPLLKESAVKCDGEFKIISQKNVGTEIFATFSIDHIDRLPIGDIGETMITLILSNPEMRFVLILEGEKGAFRMDTEEVADLYKGAIITQYEIIDWLRNYIDEGIKKIFGGVLNEVNC